MGMMSLGAFAGAALIAVWGGTRPRMRTLLPGLMLCVFSKIPSMERILPDYEALAEE